MAALISAILSILTTVIVFQVIYDRAKIDLNKVDLYSTGVDAFFMSIILFTIMIIFSPSTVRKLNKKIRKLIKHKLRKNNS